MAEITILVYLIILLLALLILVGVPLIVSFGIAGMLLFIVIPQPLIMRNIGLVSYDAILSFTLIAIPLYILTGDLVVETGVAKRLFELGDALLSWVPGGLGTGAQVACGLFAAISGSNTADAAAIGRVSTDELCDRGYPRAYAGGLVASASITGILIPPSITYIIVARVMRISVVDLFIGTIIPGLLVLTFMIITNLLITRRKGIDQSTTRIDPKRVAVTAWQSKFGLLIPVVILGGIYSGVFTATEAAIVAILIMLLYGALTRTLGLREYKGTVERSASLNGMISPLIAIFVIFSQAITFYQIPTMITEGLVSVGGGSELLVLAIVFMILLAAGAVITTAPNILLFGPLLIPVGVTLGYDIYHFSIVFLSVLALGFITPPVGLNLFVLSGVIDEPVEEIARQALPYFIAGLLAAITILAFPELSLALIELS